MFAAMALSGSALAQAAADPSQNVTVNLIRLLVKQHVITQKAADELLKQAELEASLAKKAGAQKANQPAAESAEAAPPPPAGVVRVPYVPEVVKNQIRDEIRQEVMAKAETENWAQPHAVPAWTKRFELYGDFRFRDELDLYSKNNFGCATSNGSTPESGGTGNSDACGFVDYAAFNANGPVDINPDTNPNGYPYLNTRTNRNVFNMRARLGVRAQITDAVSFSVRLASGKDNSPVSTTQLLGGGFTKDAVWLDQAYLSIKPAEWTELTFGRMPDPFDHTDLVFDENLNFDGAAARFETAGVWKGPLSLHADLGFFPLQYVSANFPNNSGFKKSDETQYLAAAQLGADLLLSGIDWRLSAAYYDFEGVRGALSAPCALYNGNKQCSTDGTRPAFMQKGNTLFLIRDILPNPSSPLDFAQPQFVGLSYNYQPLDFTTSVSVPVGKYALQLQADYVRNMGFNYKDACRYYPLGRPLTNYPVNATEDTFNASCSGSVQTGPNGYLGKATFGDAVIRDQWQWNAFFGYKYLEPDAVMDAFTDHDFHLGGTNAKGYFLGGSLAFYDNTWFTVKWMSADQVYGPTFAVDVLQFDLNARF